METKEYKIGHITYTHEELTWGQDKAILRLFHRAKRKANPDDNIDLNRIFELFARYDLLGIFLGIVLRVKNPLLGVLRGLTNLIRLRPYHFVDANKMHHSDLVQVQQDFFLLNSNAAHLLNALWNGLGLIAQTAMTPASGSGKASTVPSVPTKTRSASDAKQPNTTPAAATRRRYRQ